MGNLTKFIKNSKTKPDSNKNLNINNRPLKLIKFLFLKILNRIKQIIYRPT